MLVSLTHRNLPFLARLLDDINKAENEQNNNNNKNNSNNNNITNKSKNKGKNDIFSGIIQKIKLISESSGGKFNKKKKAKSSGLGEGEEEVDQVTEDEVRASLSSKTRSICDFL